MMVVPDVTSWGNVRRFPTLSERNRTGGAGIYYHVQRFIHNGYPLTRYNEYSSTWYILFHVRIMPITDLFLGWASTRLQVDYCEVQCIPHSQSERITIFSFSLL